MIVGFESCQNLTRRGNNLIFFEKLSIKCLHNDVNQKNIYIYDYKKKNNFAAAASLRGNKITGACIQKSLQFEAKNIGIYLFRYHF